MALCLFMLFVHELSVTPLPTQQGMPASAYGLIGLLATTGTLGGVALVRRFRKPAPVVAAPPGLA